MAESSEYLRKKFNFGTGVTNTDGIAEAEQVILNNGGTINKGFIHFKSMVFNLTPQDKQDIRDAIQFLCDEWDYGCLEFEDKLN